MSFHPTTTLLRVVLTKAQRAATVISPFQLEALTGILCGGGGTLVQMGTGVRIRFELSSLIFAQLLHNILSPNLVVSSLNNVNRKADARTGNVYESFKINTATLAVLQQLYDTFVLSGTRIIPLDIASQFTAVSLAYMIMTCGSTPA